MIIEHDGSDMIAKELVLEVGGVLETRNLTENDLVFVTNGSITAATTYGDNNTPAPISKELGGAWSLWKNLAKQDEASDILKYSENLPDQSWFVSATTTVKRQTNRAVYSKKISKRDPYAGKVVTGES